MTAFRCKYISAQPGAKTVELLDISQSYLHSITGTFLWTIVNMLLLSNL